METVEKILDMASVYFNIPYLLAFILLSYAVKKNFGVWLETITKKKWKSVYTVLVIAALVSVIFLVRGDDPMKLFLTYCLGTSLHETAFWFIENKIKRK